MKKVFLGGTCNGSLWRNKLIKQLTIDYFNPCGDVWTEEMMKEEIKQRKECDFCLYVITPKMTGMYSIAEVTDDSNKRPRKTIFCYLTRDEDSVFTDFQIKSLEQIGKLVKNNGAHFYKSLEEVSSFLNTQ
ncbi:MAG: nucleoside 2-deoxyribosyltransferase domain-containing protein [Sphingobacteriales bacterium]